MGIGTDVPTRPNQALPTTKWYVFTSQRVQDCASQTKVDEMDYVGYRTETHHDVIWLNVSMDHAHVVHVLDSFEQLVEKHENRLQRKFPTTEIVEVLDGGPQEITDQVDKLVFHRDSLGNKFREAFALQAPVLWDLLKDV